ncbi:MAG TPA: response regulator [Opitutaceae bacterium]|nr:response regulator [Opitutaceae bacterium]
MKAPAQPSAHILVVDDDSIVRNYLAASLRMHSYTVTQAESAAAARRLIQGLGTAAFDAVVTDFRMPEETGLSLLAWIRSLSGRHYRHRGRRKTTYHRLPSPRSLRFTRETHQRRSFRRIRL